MNIYAAINGIKYNIKIASDLKEVNFDNFDINTIPSYCLINNNKGTNFAISKWVSPKRTRSYPFERVYNTLSVPKKVTVIPNREKKTIQPKETLTTATKATVTIKNYLGGLYYFTTDEVIIQNNTLLLIESKHSKNSQLPSLGDIKDGLLKMILYCNFENVSIGNNKYKTKPVLKLTSTKLKGRLSSNDGIDESTIFFNKNSLNIEQKELIKKLFAESRENNFIISIEEV